MDDPWVLQMPDALRWPYVRIADVHECVIGGKVAMTLRADGSARVHLADLSKREKLAVLLALMGDACDHGELESAQSVDEAMHALQMKVADPF